MTVDTASARVRRARAVARHSAGQMRRGQSGPIGPSPSKRIAHSDAVLGAADMAVSATERPLNLDVLTPAFECRLARHGFIRSVAATAANVLVGVDAGCHHPWPTFAPMSSERRRPTDWV
jgi:hypothetical protein